jgi:hypothetical protein
MQFGVKSGRMQGHRFESRGWALGICVDSRLGGQRLITQTTSRPSSKSRWIRKAGTSLLSLGKARSSCGMPAKLGGR